MSLLSSRTSLLLGFGVRLRAAASALFPLAGEEKKSKIEAERHRPDSVALAARPRQRLQPELKPRPPAPAGSRASSQTRCLALADHAPADRHCQGLSLGRGSRA